MANPIPSQKVHRVRHELHRREVRVKCIEKISPGFMAITFAADSLKNFVSLSFDDHVKLFLPDGDGGSLRRDYTPRRFDLLKGELTIEFGIHAHGAASDWAQSAKIGDQISIGGPRGSMVISKDFDWHLLVGDAAGLPAIHRRLEELPADSRVMVCLQLPNHEDRRDFSEFSHAEVQWMSDPDELVDAIHRLILPDGEGFVWCAGEAKLMSALRQIFAEEKQVDRQHMRIASYWKHGSSDFHESLVSPDVD
ncbi:siderophore-interacting protein [Luteolibacter pohnpeiensis]|uniref:Siderophore-interacting protein n=1 Tax=Luteolibacter pohnpeiensis TaxID=454153 RepID=A0A934S639_9BACT|nr:siderophore-interacting protein [Luteolibacter pohnpeiensis]MBK1882553.1 siderophore-interacting protein [Luteolibacter pohnpeiensis]